MTQAGTGRIQQFLIDGIEVCQVVCYGHQHISFALSGWNSTQRTLLHCGPQSGRVLFGKRHDALGCSVSDEVRLSYFVQSSFTITSHPTLTLIGSGDVTTHLFNAVDVCIMHYSPLGIKSNEMFVRPIGEMDLYFPRPHRRYALLILPLFRVYFGRFMTSEQIIQQSQGIMPAQRNILDAEPAIMVVGILGIDQVSRKEGP